MSAPIVPIGHLMNWYDTNYYQPGPCPWPGLPNFAGNVYNTEQVKQMLALKGLPFSGN